MEKSWSVVIPSDSEEKLARCVDSIRRAHPEMDPATIYVVTKKIDPATVRDALKPLTYIIDTSDFVYGRRVNMGFRAAAEKDVVVMGDDAELMTTGGFDLLKAEAPLRLVACSVRGRVGPWWQKEGNRFPVVPFVSFTCVYIPRMVYKMVGPVEEGFPGYGYEDTDYCLRVQQCGLSCGVCGNVIIEHGINLKSEFIAVCGEGIVEMEAQARKAFEEKWMGDPA